MKVGVVTYAPEEVEGFDLHVYYVKWADGSVFPGAKGMQNDVTCFCDAKAIRDDPSLVAVSKNGLALRKNRRINVPFDFVCPTNPEYRAKVLDYVERLAKEEIQGVTLNLYHFPDEEFCICPRCVELWRQSGLNWVEWRAKTVTEFLKEVRNRIGSKPLYVNMLPDPVLGKERFGYDFDALAEYADTFVIPMFSKAYPSPWYWEMLARAFKSKLKKPVFTNLYVRGPNDDPNQVPTVDQLLTVAVRIARTGVDGIIFLAENAQRIRDFQKAAVQSKDVLAELDGYGGEEVLKLVDSWRSLF